MKQRPDELPSFTHKVQTGYGNLYITITEVEGRPFEVFCTIGKSGGSTMAKAEVTGRLISLALKSGIEVDEIVGELLDIDGGKQIAWKDTVIKSIPDAVGQVLKRRYLDETNS